MAQDERAPPAVASDVDPTVAGQREDQPSQDPAQPAGPQGAAGARRQRRAPADPVAWLIALATFAAYDLLSVFKYLRLDPGSWDLGIFTEYVKQIAHLHAPIVAIKGSGFNLLGDHFQPIVGLIAPFFRVFPSPETLLVAQALLTAISVIPVCRAAQELLGTWPSRAIGLAYGFSWGLQQMINFDFHEIAFAVPLLAFSLSALVRRKLRPAVLWALPLVFVKEDQGFTLAAIGLVMAGMGLAALRRARGTTEGTEGALPALEGEPTAWIRAGIFLAVWGLAWSALAIAVIIPHFNLTHHYPYWNDGGVVAPGGHPGLSTIAHQFVQDGTVKLWTVYLILLPVAFLALRSPLALIAVPSLALRFVSTNSYYWGDGWHYNATVMPIVFLAAVDGMARFRAASAQRQLGGATPLEPPDGAAGAWAASRRAPARRQPGGATPVDPPDGAAGAWAASRRAPARRQPGEPTLRTPRLPRLGEMVARYGAVVMVVIAGWLAFRFPLAGLWNAQTYEITPHVRAEEAAMAKVPDGVTVEATLTMLAPLAARDDTYWIGTSPNPAPQYIVFDNDNSGWNPPPANVLQFVDQRHPGYQYVRIFADNNVYVFRRAGRTGG